jgi:hypothetical protein
LIGFIRTTEKLRRIETSNSILELMIIAQNNILRILKRSMIDQGHLRNGEIEMQRETTPQDTHCGADGRTQE